MCYQKRHILLSEDIDGYTTNTVFKHILDINYYDNMQQSKDKNYIRSPIHLYINTKGGDANAAMAIVDIIQNSKTPIYTYSIGEVMSAGLAIFVVGDKRFAGEHSLFLYHQLHINNLRNKTLKELTQIYNESIKLQNIYDKIIINNTKITQQQLDKYKNNNIDWFIDAFEALQLGICDKINFK